MITVVGIAMGGEVSPRARAAIAAADFLVGGTHQLALFPEAAAERFDHTGRMKDLRPFLGARRGRAVVVLASGDPLFYGIGSFLARLSEAGQCDALTVLPAPSSIAEAFARIGLAWEDAAVISAHGRPLADVGAALDRTGKVAVLTDDTNTPAAIGAWLGDRDGDAWICERLGAPDERVRKLTIAALREAESDPVNVLVLVAPKRARPVVPFTDDDAFEKKVPKKGLLTKREVRTLSLAALGLRPGDVMWDLGAGSGAVAIEAALLGASRVWAVEKNADGCTIIRDNVARFATPHVEVVHAKAPDGLDALPDPDRVFIGGSAGSMATLVEVAAARLRPGGAVVVNVATVENLAEAVAAAKATGLAWECTQIAVARSSPILNLTRFEALNPIWIVAIRNEAP